MIGYCNPATSAIFNYDLNDLPGSNMEMLFESPKVFTAILEDYRDNFNSTKEKFWIFDFRFSILDLGQSIIKFVIGNPK
jgi:hypothetical protein